MTRLWRAMQDAGMAGADGVMSAPYDGQHPRGAVLDTIETQRTLDAGCGVRIIKRHHGGDGVGEEAVADDPAAWLEAVTVMYRRRGYDPWNRDWFRPKYPPDGTLDGNPHRARLAGRVAEGAPQGCIVCHRRARRRSGPQPRSLSLVLTRRWRARAAPRASATVVTAAARKRQRPALARSTPGATRAGARPVLVADTELRHGARVPHRARPPMPAHVPPASSSLLRRRHSCAATALGVLLLGVAAAAAAGQYLGLPLRDFELLGTYPHDPRAFTQGLVFDRGQLIEGTGRYGESRVLVRELGDARPLREHRLPRQLFGEGVAVVGDRVLQLTWRARVGFVYARDTLAPLGHFRYDTEGWGLAYDEVRLRLLKSDGSARLEFMHPLTLAVTGSCEVRAGTIPVTRLNELEMVAGLLYANVWGSDYIARIDPESCTVRDWVDLSRLSARFAAQADVLNGIAYDAAADRLFVTGKLWPALYEIKVIEPGG